MNSCGKQIQNKYVSSEIKITISTMQTKIWLLGHGTDLTISHQDIFFSLLYVLKILFIGQFLSIRNCL